jgi:hypothetical protein
MATTIEFDYPAMNITNIVNDSSNKWITGTCNPPSTATNITYNTNGAKAVYKSSQMWIVGNGNSNLHKVPGVNFNGELIIKNTSDVAGTFWMCFLLASSATAQKTDIDVLFDGTSNALINLATDIIPSTGNNNFLFYKNTVDSSPVAIYTSPIQISSDLLQYENNLKVLSLSGNDAQTISNNSSFEWMECDNVPIGSDTIATYSLPIQSGLVKDINTLDTFKTIVMFIIFFIACVFSYFLIPSAYLALIGFVVGNRYMDPITKKKWVGWIDMGITAVLVGISIILMLGGTFGQSKKSVDVLLSGVIIAIIYIIGYVIIQSKKLGGRFIEGVRYDYM